MSLAVARRAGNIRRSFATRVGDSITTVDGVIVPVYHDQPFADPDAARDDNGTPLNRWVASTWVAETAGSRGFSIVQLDIRTRVGAEGAAAGDPQGLVAESIADAIVAIFSGVDGDGLPRAWIEILDFAVPAAPVATGECALVIATSGDHGEPEERARFGSVGGLNRILLRYRLRLAQDLAGPAAFYTA